jgi:proteic killer suppression protein
MNQRIGIIPHCPTKWESNLSKNLQLIPRRGIIGAIMIKSFRDKETEKVFRRLFSRKLPHNIQRAALKRLAYLHAAKTLSDLLIPPSNYLEKLRGDREGQHSIRINDQWRVCFEWIDENAHNVEIVDYH